MNQPVVHIHIQKALLKMLFPSSRLSIGKCQQYDMNRIREIVSLRSLQNYAVLSMKTVHSLNFKEFLRSFYKLFVTLC